jgi:hypothetical protein
MTETQLPNPAPYISPEVKEFWDATAARPVAAPT